MLGKILTVDLSTHSMKTQPLDMEVARHYLGGRGLNVWRLRRCIDSTTDPLGPDNVLIMSCGLLTGTAVPASSRLHLGARSPQTGLLGSSNVGGHFGAALRAAGFQIVEITGRSDAPVYLWIDEDGAAIRDASALWGLDTRAVAEALGAQNGNAKNLMIGVGGENLVRYASINTEDGHAAGRTGLGAVMGSKYLKAVAIAHKPDRRPTAPAVRALMREYALSIRSAESYEIYAEYSNSSYLNWVNEQGILGTRNFQQAQFEGAERVDGSKLTPYVKKAKSCHRCPVHCKAEVKFNFGRFEQLIGERPDIEPLMAFGPKVGVDDPEAVLYLHSLANTYGIDVISTGGVLAFAIDLYRRGILKSEDTDGVVLDWGDADAMGILMGQIARREGLGDLLADGVRDAAQRIGRGAEHYAYHSKGLELPGYDPRGALGAALGFAVSNRGADFTSVYPTLEFYWTPQQGEAAFGTTQAVNPLSPEGKGALVQYASIVSAVLDALGICKVPVLSIMGDFTLDKEARLAAALTGWGLTAESLFQVGYHIVTEERHFNLMCGLTREDDDLPAKFAEEPVPDGPTRGQTVSLEVMLRDFYAAMGWDSEGHPPDGDISLSGE